MLISPARRVAFDVLLRVEGGAWASDLLRSASAGLDSRDAGLASEIVFGVLRYQAQLDHLIGRAKLDAEVRIALRIGLYQLHHLTRVPAHAAVSESVELVKQAKKRSASGLVNAILRKSSAAGKFPDDATRLSVPAWLLERWTNAFGADTAATVAEAFLHPPEIHFRGERQQDIGSQSVVPYLDLQPGMAFLDVCAAPGNKTAQALEMEVRAIACDLHLHRLRAMPSLACPLVNLDATASLPFRRVFDRILVDAPCSGTGTLGRNPEIKWRLRPQDLDDLHRRQVKILKNALDCLKPRGVLVYSTCSLEREENEAVVLEVLGQLPEEIYHRIPGIQPGDGFFAAVIRS